MATSISPITQAVVPGLRQPTYSARLAVTDTERRAAYKLRFEVFNVELHEGLDRSYSDGQDIDLFDAICDHLVVESAAGEIVGTYRLQAGTVADRNLGFYSEQEFDFTPYRSLRSQMLELGRACVHRDHRSFEVVSALWRGIGQYAQERGCRYLVGCSSLASQDPAEGWSTYRKLQDCLVAPELRTQPTARYRLPAERASSGEAKVPKLLRTYLAVGAKIGGDPAIDREFKTIDFLTWMDLESLTPASRMRYLGQRCLQEPSSNTLPVSPSA
jgi:putative hemolysin